jgi:metal-responsive CopG/Arc/MetJ family transcriptional regulator
MATKKRKRPRGRPSLGDAMEQLAIRFPKEMLAAVDEIILGRLDRPDRSQIIRELIAEGLEARKRR